MSLIKSITSVTLLVGLITVSQSGIAKIAQAKCGDYIFQVKIVKKKPTFKKHFELYSLGNNHRKKLFYKTKPGIGLITSCVGHEKNKSLMLFLELHGGEVEDNYGIYDPQLNKVLLKPYDLKNGNEMKAQEIIGYSPRYIIQDYISLFCCGKQSNENGNLEKKYSKEGEFNGAIECARQMIADGYDINFISKITKLSLKNIKFLQK